MRMSILSRVLSGGAILGGAALQRCGSDIGSARALAPEVAA